MIRILSLFFFLLTSTFLKAQDFYINKPRLENITLNPSLFNADVKLHTAVYPLPINKYVYKNSEDSIKFKLPNSLLKTELKSKNNKLSVGPLLNLKQGYQFGSENKLINTLGGGAFLNYAPNKHWNLYFDVFGLRENLPTYLETFAESTNTLPGYGTAYRINDTWNTANLTALASYTPNDNFFFQAGKGKVFLGEGYRSLFISDNAPNHYLLTGSANLWRFKYTALFTVYDAAANANGIKSNYSQTMAAYHHLSINITKRLNFSLFESVIWQNKDSLQNRGFEYNYLNPAVFYRPVEFAIGSSDNVKIGAALTYKAWENTVFYSQLVIDEFNIEFLRNTNNWWGNKFGAQLGLKTIDAFKVKGLFLLAELNIVRPYTYSHYTDLQAFGHLNQPLAHPLGANFYEIIGIVGYQKNKLFLNARLSYAQKGQDINGLNYGGNIFIPNRTRVSNENVSLLQGNLNSIYFASTEVGYRLNYESDFTVFFNAWLRHSSLSIGENQTLAYLGVGIRCRLSDFYRDF